MRTDTQRLDWILAALDSGNEEPLERLQAAYTFELRGRAAVDAAMGAKVVEPGEPMPELTAIDMAVAEVGRIRNVKGFSEDGDDTQINEQLAQAAACYLRPDSGSYWPFRLRDFKPSPDDRKKELTKGIALALCELDRLIRAERRASLELQADVCREMNEAACEPVEIGVPAAREFKVGDRVRVTASNRDNPFGWVSAMDALVGRDLEVVGVRAPTDDYAPVGFLLDEGFVYPAEHLEHADD